jgi:hypothetical protein
MIATTMGLKRERERKRGALGKGEMGVINECNSYELTSWLFFTCCTRQKHRQGQHCKVRLKSADKHNEPPFK